MSSHPFLSLTGNPAWENLKPEHIREDITLALEKAEANLQQIRDLKPEEINFRNTVKALENASYELYYAWGLVTHLDSVCNSAELREVHNEMLPAVSTFGAKITLDAGLWKVLQIFAESKETSSLKPIDRRLLEETLLDFKEAGADLPNEKRQRLEEISQQLAQVTQKFSEQVLDATNEWKLIVREEDKLKGLPETAREAARQSAIEKLGEEEGKDAWVFTLHTPSMLPVLQYLEDDEIRKEVWSASDNLCVKAPYENEPLIREILKLRQEKAEILGKDNFADAVLARRMAKNGEKADQFVSELRDKTIPFFQQENQELEEFKAEKNGKPVDGLQPWEVGFWSEKLKKERYDFDDEDLRPYFPIQSVLSGMFELATRIFGLTIKEQPTQFQGKTIDNGLSTDASPQSVWHEEVRFYDLIDSQSGKHLGSFYADWHPRSSKRAGAWMNYFKTGEPSGNGEREPHLGLICGNLTAPTPTKPALLTHYEVETVFHEFGHLLHHLCGNVPHRSLNGVNVPWDFVELPSQIMENWCWERESLDLFARHHETNEPIPEELFQKMLRARNFMAGNTMMRQLAFAKLDLHIHRVLAKQEFDSLESSLQETLREYLPKRKTTPRTIALRFSHLFSSPVGYAAAYYSYKWAEVLDADAFTRFQKEGIMNGQTGIDFREKILSQGNSVPPDQLYRDFMGRDPEVEPLLVRSGLK
jgi:oligopeptidase A